MWIYKQIEEIVTYAEQYIKTLTGDLGHYKYLYDNTQDQKSREIISNLIKTQEQHIEEYTRVAKTLKDLSLNINQNI